MWRSLNLAITLNTKYADLALGVTDCLNIVLAHRYRTNTVFTLDERHFRAVQPLSDAAAFHLLPADFESSRLLGKPGF